MKKLTLKPGFEFIFSLSLVAILGLPPFVFAQKTKDLTININNGDTVINGKNIRELSAKDRQWALKDISQISISEADTGNNKFSTGKRVVIIKRDGLGQPGGKDMVIERHGPGDGNLIIESGPDGDHGPIMAEGGHRRMRMHMRKQMDNDSTFAFSYRMNGDEQPRIMEEREFRFGPEHAGMMGFDRKNTQNFSYTNTDGQGISTHVSYHVSEPSGAVAHIPGEREPTEYGVLDINDLNLVPEFSKGKTVLMFSLPSKAVAEVKLKDSNGNVLWSGKALNGNFSKSFELGLNGEYYLHIKQGSKIAVKKIFKEQM